MKKYIKVEGIGANVLEVELKYNLGGYNYFTGKEEERGYYLHIVPMERISINGLITETYTAFTGVKVLVKSVKRKSKKAEQEAINIINNIEKQYIDIVCKNNGLTIID